MPEGPAQPLKIQAPYTWEFADGAVFSDAIVMERTAFQALTNAQIKQLKQDRAQAWKQTVDQSRTRTYTETELRAQRRETRAALQERRDQVAADLARVETDIAAEA